MDYATNIRDTDNKIWIKTWHGGSGSVARLMFDTIQMKNVCKCIVIDKYYYHTVELSFNDDYH